MLSQRAYAPDRFHSSTKISPTEAQANLAAYLDKTSSNAYLHPDASLSQIGIQFPAQSGSQGGLAIHHLRRIAAGLRGENLIAETNDELRALFADELKQDQDDEKERGSGGLKSSFKSGKRKRVDDQQESNGDAIDADQYAQEQTEILEEIGNDTLAGQGEQVDSVPEITTVKGSADKAARKKAKKEMKLKQKQEQQAENIRLKANEADEVNDASKKKKSKKSKDASAG